MHPIATIQERACPAALSLTARETSLKETNACASWYWTAVGTAGWREMTWEGCDKEQGEEGGIHVQTNASLEFYTALRCSVFGFQAALHY